MLHRDDISANPHFATAQLLRAQSTAETHPDAATRERAEARVQRWRETFERIKSGHLTVGSRTPIRDVPAWITPEVAQGGFATGNFIAAGPLQAHETAILGRLTSRRNGERAAINAHYVTDAGMRELLRMLDSGCYRITAPEEGALLVVAYLISVGEQEEARNLLSELAPWMGQLRFYPQPAEEPQDLGTNVVNVATVGEVTEALKHLRLNPAVSPLREFVGTWAPLYDKIVELWMETYEEGWPCQVYPDGWRQIARSYVDTYRRARADHKQVCRKYAEEKAHGLRELVDCMEIALADPRRLTGRQVGRVRSILTGIANKRGLPGSDQLRALRLSQWNAANSPKPAEVAPLLVARLAAYAQESGLTAQELDAVTSNVTDAECLRFGLTNGMCIPDTLHNKVRRALSASLDELVKLNLVPSAELLAKILPQISANVRSAQIEDPRLQRLDTGIYRAFRNRRSLLLFWYQKQVQINELPWVAALERRFRGDDAKAREALGTLVEVGRIAVKTFPAQIVPNKLVTELSALAEAGGLNIPLTEELATDIFMGSFTAKFLRAAKVAARLLRGSLYERYYGLDYGRVAALQDVRREGTSRWSANMSEGFNALCYELAGEQTTGRRGYWRRPAENGKVIEQELILTTHNLATLVDEVGVRLADDELGDLAMACFTEALRLLQIKLPDSRAGWKSRLQNIKNAAYAWRQMVFFLSLQDPARPEREFFHQARRALLQQPANFAAKFQPALGALYAAYTWAPFPVERGTSSPNRFLGWTTERHWILPPRQEPPDQFIEEDEEEESW